jgi:uncharacterized membrane protein
MNASAESPVWKIPPRLLGIVLALLALAVAWFVYRSLHFFADISLESYTPYFWPRRGGLVPHVFGGLVAITTGLVQMWLGLTHRTGTLHRKLGWCYVAGILVGSVAGFYTTLTIPGSNLAYQSGTFMMCVAWAGTTGMAVWSIRNRAIWQHRDWMLRSYIVTFAFVTFRFFDVWLNSLASTYSILTRENIDATMAWACWAVPLLLAEPLIQIRAVRRARTSS